MRVDDLFGYRGPLAVVAYTAAAVGLGLGVEYANSRMGRAACGSRPCARMLAPKLAVIAAVFLALQYALPYFALDWQNTTPGLFFVSVFFGLQASTFADAQSLLV